MKEFLRSAYVIGRRDFVASVYSKSFLLFLLGPLIIIAMSIGFGSITRNVAQQNTRTSVAVIADPADHQAIEAAHQRLSNALGEHALPEFSYHDPDYDVAAQSALLLGSTKDRVIAVLSGGIDNPRLSGSLTARDPLHKQIALVVDEARQMQAAAQSGARWQPTNVPVASTSRSAGVMAAARAATASIGQFLLFFLTVLLSGMLLSNLLEEKSNKIIEVLAAAVPVDAIFLGKVVSMLAISLTGIAVWSSAALIGILLLGNGSAPLPAPAIGWPLFALSVIVYFSINYLLLGALFLGIGSQASSVREVQTLSMPITVGQMLIFALAIMGAGNFNGPIGYAAAIFPLSSPLMMVARAAQAPELWTHLVALLWQGLWVWLVVRLGAAMFRRNVLKSGPSWRAALTRKKA